MTYPHLLPPSLLLSFFLASSSVLDINYISIKLPAGNRLGNNADPFVELTLHDQSKYSAGPQKQRSSIKTNTLHPKWFPAERFQFKVSELDHAKVVINVFHFLPILAATSLGDAVIHLKEYDIGDRRQHQEYKLYNENTGEQEGSIVCSVECMTAEQCANVQEHTIYEFNRWNGEWGHLDCFILTDPGRWSTIDGKTFANDIDDIAPPVHDHWTVVRDWHTGTTDKDPDGWEYSTDMRSNYWHPSAEGSIYCVRRRIWARKVARVDSDWFDSSYGHD